MLIDEPDGQLIESLLRKQTDNGRSYEFDPEAYTRLVSHTVRRADKTVSVSVPADAEDVSEPYGQAEQEVRESIRIQALIANIGSQMGNRICVPKADKQRVGQELPSLDNSFLDRLPLNYDDVTISDQY